MIQHLRDRSPASCQLFPINNGNRGSLAFHVMDLFPLPFSCNDHLVKGFHIHLHINLQLQVFVCLNLHFPDDIFHTHKRKMKFVFPGRNIFKKEFAPCICPRPLL